MGEYKGTYDDNAVLTKANRITLNEHEKDVTATMTIIVI
jgi:hypothetical protein